MANHQLCTQKNQRLLLEAKMNQLSSLVHEIQETEWMFEKKDGDSDYDHGFMVNMHSVASGGGGGTATGNFGIGNQKRPVGFHRGLQERW